MEEGVGEVEEDVEGVSPTLPLRAVVSHVRQTPRTPYEVLPVHAQNPDSPQSGVG